MKNSNKTRQGYVMVELGGHTYNIVDVSSRYFGEMYIIMKDGDYFFHAETSLLAAYEIMKRSIG